MVVKITLPVCFLCPTGVPAAGAGHSCRVLPSQRLGVPNQQAVRAGVVQRVQGRLVHLVLELQPSGWVHRTKIDGS